MCGVRAFKLGWLATCCGAVVVVVESPVGRGTADVVGVVVATVVVVVGSLVVVVVGDLVVVVVDGVGATVELVVAARAPVAPITAGKGPDTMTAAPAMTILLG
jgi:hypothetical protein